MPPEAPDILPTTMADLDIILWLFDMAIQLQEKAGYRVWQSIDKKALENEIYLQRQYKIVSGAVIIGIFSIQFDDGFIWRSMENGDAVYLHRIVASPASKGQRLFEKVLIWTRQLALEKRLRFIRMDTWADNSKLIEYYRSFGFGFIEEFTTGDDSELPIQNRNLKVTLLQLDLKNTDGRSSSKTRVADAGGN